MKKVIILLLIFNSGLLYCQTVLNSIQTKSPKKTIEAITLIDLETKRMSVDYSDVQFVDTSFQRKSNDSIENLISTLQNQIAIDKSKSSEIYKLRQKLKTSQQELNTLRSKSADVNNLLFKFKYESIKKYKDDNIAITRECEVNYYLLEDKLKDLKLNYSSALMSKREFIDSVDIMMKSIYMTWFEIELIKRNFDELTDEVKKLGKSKIIYNSDIKKLFVESDNLQIGLDTGIIHINDRFKELRDRISSLEEKITKKTDALNGIAASPAISNFANKYSPSLTLQATAKFGKSYNELGLFTGGLFSENANLNENLYFPELSDFSIYYKGSTTAIALVNENQKTGLNYEIYYMSKQFAGDSILGISGFNYQSVQFKSGFEFVIYKDVISIYGNINLHMPITNKINLEKIVGNSRTDQVNFDAGVKMLLSPSQQNNSGTKLFVNLNFMFLNQSMKNAIGANDNILPNLKIGIEQRLTKF